MVDFPRTEKGGPDRKEPSDKPWRVPSTIVSHVENDLYLLRLNTKLPEVGWDESKRGALTLAALLEPGVFDDVPALRPWAVVDVIYGSDPTEAHYAKLMCVAGRRHALLKYERDRGLQLRQHVIMGVLVKSTKIAAHFGDEALDAAPAPKSKSRVAA